jgi:hypothetical protein
VLAAYVAEPSVENFLGHIFDAELLCCRLHVLPPLKRYDFVPASHHQVFVCLKPMVISKCPFVNEIVSAIIPSSDGIPSKVSG